MEIRIKFSADVYIKGDTLDEIRHKWGNLNLFSDETVENGVTFDEHLLIEDADTHEDVSHDFWGD
jgi:hypothetical protein